MDAATITRTDMDIEIDAQGKLYRFLSLCFAHPDQSTLAWWQGGTAVEEILGVVSGLQRGDELSSHLTPLLDEVEDEARKLSPDEAEAIFIKMFACGVPQVLCPPYSSLYTSPDDDKRLFDMHAVKEFYADCGMQFSEDFKDLPDHASVEFEFLQYLTYEETRARARREDQLASLFAGKALEFIERHALGLTEGMAAVVATIRPQNMYCRLVEVASHVLRHDHEWRLAAASGQSSLRKG